MKRIVAFVFQAEAETRQHGSAGGEADPPRDELAAWPVPHGAGSMKLEVLVSDDQAQRLIALLLEHASLPSDQPRLQELLQQEVENAGPDAQDLFERIVIAVERSLITYVYAECNGVKTRAAARLGINRNTLHKKLRDYGLAANGLADHEDA